MLNGHDSSAGAAHARSRILFLVASVLQDGKPFFYLGDTAWLLFQRLNHEEVEEYLKDRAEKGFVPHMNSHEFSTQS